MPEDINSLLDALGVDPKSGDNEGVDNQDTGSDEGTDESKEEQGEGSANDKGADNAEGSDNTESKDEDDSSATDVLEKEKANQAFAAMRTENNKYKKFMQTLMEGSNFVGDEAAFIEALTDEAYKKKAKLQGMAANPEILRKVDAQAEQIKQLTESQQEQTLLLGLKNLQSAFNLSGKQVEEFVEEAVNKHIDLLAPGADFNTLYRGMFFDNIVSQRIEEERQKWIAQSDKAGNATKPDGKSGKKDPTTTDVKTMTELNSLLNSVSKDFR